MVKLWPGGRMASSSGWMVWEIIPVKDKQNKVQISYKKITRRTIGAHGYNSLQNELSLAILWYNRLSKIYFVSSFTLMINSEISCSSPPFSCNLVLSHASSRNCWISHFSLSHVILRMQLEKVFCFDSEK